MGLMKKSHIKSDSILTLSLKGIVNSNIIYAFCLKSAQVFGWELSLGHLTENLLTKVSQSVWFLIAERFTPYNIEQLAF